MPKEELSENHLLPPSANGDGYCKVDLQQNDYYPSWNYPLVHEIEGLVTSYVSDFSVKMEDGQFTNCGGFNLVPFDDSVCGFFNRDLAHSMAEAHWALSADSISIFQKYYHLESAIARQSACWEYLFQIIAVHLQLEDSFYATRDGMRQVLGHAVYDQELIPIQNGHRYEYHGKSHAESLAILKELRKRFDFVNPRFNAKAFYKHMSKHYGFSGWLDGVKKLFRDSASGKIREHRNTLSHVHSLASVAFIDDRHGGPVPRTAINGRALKLGDVKLTWKDLLRAHRNLHDAILITRTAILHSDYPNTKKNENVDFQVRQVKCLRCDVATFIPVPEIIPDMKGRIYCQNCGWWPKEDEFTDLNNVVAINEVVWSSVVSSRVNSMQGREDLLRASLDEE